MSHLAYFDPLLIETTAIEDGLLQYYYIAYKIQPLLTCSPTIFIILTLLFSPRPLGAAIPPTPEQTNL